MISTPIDLGAAGLEDSLTFQFYIQADAGSLAESADASTIAASPVSGPLYQLTGLPDLAIGQIGIVYIVDPPSLFTYEAPAPEPVVIYQGEEPGAPNGPYHTGDGIGIYAWKVAGMPDPTGATAAFSAWDPAAQRLILDSRPAGIQDVTTATDGSFGFTLTYQVERSPAMTAAGQTLKAFWVVTFASGAPLVIPKGDPLTIVVQPVLGAGGGE